MSDPIRHATAQDAQSIADFQVAMALETENKKLDPDKVLVAVKSVFEDSQKGFYLVAEVDGQVVGSLMITYEWSDWRNGNMWYIQSVFVMAPHRGKGLFTAMYHKVMELAKSENATYVRLYVETDNDVAQKTYEKLGMKRMPYYMYDVKVE